MGIARIKGREADGSIVLDLDYIPPCLTIAAHPAFAAFLDELDGKLASVAASRVGYVLDPTGRGAAEVQDLLVLEIVNRARPVVAHLNTHRTWHPEDLYRFLLGLCGEMATYGAADRQPPALPAYIHPEPGPAFRVLFDAVRRLLIELARPERKAAPVPLRLHRSGLRTTTEETTPQLFASATIVLAVSAAMPAERIRQQFPRLAMIGPAEDFNDIWTAKLRGIPVEPLPVAPRQIPFHAGMVYFELDRSDPYFRKLPRSTGLALAIEGEWPELAIECWAVRD
jgi:type VI secretion system protein ImpJ